MVVEIFSLDVFIIYLNIGSAPVKVKKAPRQHVELTQRKFIANTMTFQYSRILVSSNLAVHKYLCKDQ